MRGSLMRMRKLGKRARRSRQIRSRKAILANIKRQENALLKAEDKQIPMSRKECDRIDRLLFGEAGRSRPIVVDVIEAEEEVIIVTDVNNEKDKPCNETLKRQADENIEPQLQSTLKPKEFPYRILVFGVLLLLTGIAYVAYQYYIG
tara:strand:- start:206502 stop:206942 length:441 start_codon:yes stop_codon:yes gene_type:complete